MMQKLLIVYINYKLAQTKKVFNIVISDPNNVNLEWRYGILMRINFFFYHE